METLTLHAGKATGVVQLMGGELISFVDKQGNERLWHGDPNVWPGHAPVLFPIVCSLKNDQIVIDGQTYTIAKHGFAMRNMFRVEKLGSDFVELVLEDNEETRKEFPFAFALHVIHTLTEVGFTTEYVVENKSGKEMPFCLGGHPGIKCPMQQGERFEDYQLVFPEMENGENAFANGALISRVAPLDFFHNSRVLPLSYTYFDDMDTIILTDLKSRYVDLVHKDTGKGVRFAFPKMPVLAVWSKPINHGPYVCLEPWHGLPGFEEESGLMKDKPHVIVLNAGEAFKTGYSLSLLD